MALPWGRFGFAGLGGTHERPRAPFTAMGGQLTRPHGAYGPLRAPSAGWPQISQIGHISYWSISVCGCESADCCCLPLQWALRRSYTAASLVSTAAAGDALWLAGCRMDLDKVDTRASACAKEAALRSAGWSARLAWRSCSGGPA